MTICLGKNCSFVRKLLSICVCLLLSLFGLRVGCGTGLYLVLAIAIRFFRSGKQLHIMTKFAASYI